MGWFVLSTLLLLMQVPAQSDAVVAQTMRIEIDRRIHTARQINGRWWSEDNRELRQTNVGWLWTVSGGNAWQLVRFDHHRPVNPAKVNLITRSMGPDQVRAILGPPNSVFPSDRPAAQESFEEQKENRQQRQIPASQEQFRKQLREEMARRRAQGNSTQPK
jgi:hypothetical protein